MTAAVTYIYRGALGGMIAFFLLLEFGLLWNSGSVALMIFYGFFVAIVSAAFGATVGAVLFLLSKLLGKSPCAAVRVVTGFTLAILAFVLVLNADRNNPSAHLNANKSILDGILFYGLVGLLSGLMAEAQSRPLRQTFYKPRGKHHG